MPDTATQTPALSTLDDSFEHCRRVTRARARNFYYGLKLTPEPKRSALYAVYAFMRACDDLADDPTSTSPTHTRDQIEAFRTQMNTALDQPLTLDLPTTSPDREGGVSYPHHNNQPPGSSGRAPDPLDPIWPAFRQTMHDYPIDRALLHAMLDGQLRDLDPTDFKTFDDLYDYCYKVASVVGLTCIAVWGYTGGQPTRKLAEHRGIAFQLTNILRDLTEDAHRNRVYLPTQDLAEHGFTPDTLRDQLQQRRNTPQLTQLIAAQANRALDYYQRSADLDSFIDPACRPTSSAVMRIYRGLLNKIIRRPERVLTERVRLTKIHKVVIALTASRTRA